MYKAYSLKLNNNFSGIINKKPKEKKEIEINLIDFCEEDGTIRGDDLIDIWFPFEKYDVFLSHSHMDEDLAYKFSNYLEEKFGIKTFIDSQVWEHMNKLIKKLDKEFAYQEKKGTYDYDVRNVTTAHVHNMLSVALTKMMDACECVFFLNTKNSFVKEIEKTPSNQTYSSWIYLEISNISSLRTLIRREENKIVERGYVHDSVTKASAVTESFKIAYGAEEIKGLPILKEDNLLRWERLSNDNRLWGANSLDALYKCVPMKFKREGEK